MTTPGRRHRQAEDTGCPRGQMNPAPPGLRGPLGLASTPSPLGHLSPFPSSRPPPGGAFSPDSPRAAAPTSWDMCCSDASSWILISGHAGSPDLPASGWGDREGPGEGGRREPPHWPRGGTRESDAWMGGRRRCSTPPPPPSPSLREPPSPPFLTPPPSSPKRPPEGSSLLGEIMTQPLSPLWGGGAQARHTPTAWGGRHGLRPSWLSLSPSCHKGGLAGEAACGLVPGELPPLVVLTLSSSHVL